MKIIVEDTNIIIDLFNTGLLHFCKNMDIEFHTTNFVIKEIKKPEQRSTVKGLISNKELNMAVLNTEEMLQLANLEEECRGTNNLSTADCSVVFLAEKLGSRLLTADQKLMHFAKKRGLEVSGLLWMIDEMVETGVVRPKEMVKYLKRYLETNKSAPEKEVNKRIEEYKNTKQ